MYFVDLGFSPNLSVQDGVRGLFRAAELGAFYLPLRVHRIRVPAILFCYRASVVQSTCTEDRT